MPMFYTKVRDKANKKRIGCAFITEVRLSAAIYVARDAGSGSAARRDRGPFEEAGAGGRRSGTVCACFGDAFAVRLGQGEARRRRMRRGPAGRGTRSEGTFCDREPARQTKILDGGRVAV